MRKRSFLLALASLLAALAPEVYASPVLMGLSPVVGIKDVENHNHRHSSRVMSSLNSGTSKLSPMVRSSSMVKPSTSSTSLVDAGDEDRSRLHADTLFLDLRGDVDFGYAIPSKAPFEIGNLEFMENVEKMAAKLRSRKMYKLVEYEHYSQVKDLYDNLELTGTGAYGRMYRANIRSPRRLPSGEVIPAGTRIGIKAQPINKRDTFVELEALARLSWLSTHKISDFFVKPYGVFFSAKKNILPVARGHRLAMDQNPMIYVEMEWIDNDFFQMNYNRELRLTDGSVQPNPNLKMVPDPIVFETIWGEYAAAKFLLSSAGDLDMRNYAVKRVDYWRMYCMKLVFNGQVHRTACFAFAPGLMAKRLDSGIWSGSLGLLDVWDGKYQRSISDEAISALEGMAAFEIFRAVDPVKVLVKNLDKHFLIGSESVWALPNLRSHFDNYFDIMTIAYDPYSVDENFKPPAGQEMRVFNMEVIPV